MILPSKRWLWFFLLVFLKSVSSENCYACTGGSSIVEDDCDDSGSNDCIPGDCEVLQSPASSGVTAWYV